MGGFPPFPTRCGSRVYVGAKKLRMLAVWSARQGMPAHPQSQ